jgi:hypothetical protein
MTKPHLILSLCSVIVLPLNVRAAERLQNGHFESLFYAPGVPASWKATAGDGNSNLQDTTHLSPFTNIYPAGSNSIRLTDGTSDSIYPYLVQTFSPATADFHFSFEFYLDGVTDAPWKISLGNIGANLDFLINAANSFQFAGATTGAVATLSPGVWYQLDASINDTTQTFSGSLVSFGGTPVSFSGSLYLDSPATTNYVQIQDFSSNQNSTLYVDNVSVRTVPEPSTIGALICGLPVLLGFRRRIR